MGAGLFHTWRRGVRQSADRKLSQTVLDPLGPEKTKPVESGRVTPIALHLPDEKRTPA